MKAEELAKYPYMSADEFRVTMNQLSKIFDIVRAVNPSTQRVMSFQTDGSMTVDRAAHCFETWKKTERCTNCVSSKAYCNHSRLTKFEFIDDDIYHVITQYVEVNGKGFVVELVEKDDDNELAGAFNPTDFISRMKEYTESLYSDSLTKVRNRRFYDDQLLALEMDAVAMLDLDNFKDINDKFGHGVGDKALQAAAQIIRKCVPEENSIVRYGGDEFIIAYPEISYEDFCEQLELIRTRVEKILIPELEGKNLTVSIGGIYGSGVVTELAALADERMYVAKENRNNTSVSKRNI